MPIPKPKDGEEKEDFIERCMSNATMNDEYPESDQRAAICNTQWREKKMIYKFNNPLEDCELRFADNDKGEFEGYASKFNGLDAVMDTILPGAFKKSLNQKRAPAMFVNHNSYDVPVGDWTALSEDSAGLYVKGKIDMNHKDGLTVYSALKRGAMDAMSIGFRIPRNGAEEKEDGTRIIKEVDLKEISIVNFPADDKARVAIVKQYIDEIESFKDAETILRDSGYSKSAACAFVSRIKAMVRREAEVRANENTKDVTSLLIESINKM